MLVMMIVIMTMMTVAIMMVIILKMMMTVLFRWFPAGKDEGGRALEADQPKARATGLSKDQKILNNE